MGNKMIFKDKSTFVMMGFLLLFWIVIDGKISVESLIIGTVASLSIVYLNRDLVVADNESQLFTVSFYWNYATLIAVLIMEIFKANIQVARIVLSPKMDISPSFVKVPVRPIKDFNKVLYGNIITLTPGTFTVDIDENNYVIHSLTDDAKEALFDSPLEEHVMRLEVKGK